MVDTSLSTRRDDVVLVYRIEEGVLDEKKRGDSCRMYTARSIERDTPILLLPINIPNTLRYSTDVQRRRWWLCPCCVSLLTRAREGGEARRKEGRKEGGRRKKVRKKERKEGAETHGSCSYVPCYIVLRPNDSVIVTIIDRYVSIYVFI